MLLKHAAIVGCGWVGQALAERWLARGMQVVGTTTRAERVPELEGLGIRAYCIGSQTAWDTLPREPELLVITVPPGRRHPERIAVYPQRIAELAARAASDARVIYLSSTGVYGSAKGDVDEQSVPAPVTDSARAVLECEHRLRATLAERLTILRLGGLVGPDRHPGRWFAGKKDAPDGDAPVNLVHRDDVCDAIDAVVEHNAFGKVFNVVAHAHPTKCAYYSDVCQRYGYAAPSFKAGSADSKCVHAKRISTLMKRRIELPFAHDRSESAQ